MKHTAGDWRGLARERFDTLLNEVRADWEAEKTRATEAAAEMSRRSLAESANQGLRRLRQAASPDQLSKLLEELTQPFALRCAVFVFHEDGGEAQYARGLGPTPIRFAPNDGAAFRAAIESQDPVIAVAIPSEISQDLAERVGMETTSRVYLFPLVVRGQVRSVLFAAGEVVAAVLELFTGMAAERWETLSVEPAVERKNLVLIQGAPDKSRSSKRTAKWEELDAAAQALHLRAQRSARLRVAEMRLQHGDALRRGVAGGDIYDALREPIEQARDEFRRDFISASPTMVDYLYLEIVRGLTQDNEGLLGTNFPGPLV